MKNDALQILRRNWLRMTQQEFADLLGVTKDSVRYWETNVRPLTEDRALEITLKTGVDPRSLLDGRGIPLDLNGDHYTPDTFKQWKPIEKSLDRFVSLICQEKRLVALMEGLGVQHIEEFLSQSNTNDFRQLGRKISDDSSRPLFPILPE